MDILTDKQKANRAYYWKNAEKIKAQKRSAYRKKVAASDKPKAARVKPREPVLKRKHPGPCAAKKRSARQCIEDLKIAKELGIEYGLLNPDFSK